MEELYPFPIEEYSRTIARYRTRQKSYGVRKSRRTRGPGTRFATGCKRRSTQTNELYYAGRPDAAAPASGIHALHVRQQQALVSAALASPTHERAAGRPVGKRA